MIAGKRDRAQDLFKGLMTLLMVYCHVLQFFGDETLSPAVRYWTELANLTVFPGFLFAFGRNSARAYLSRPFRQSAPRLGLNAMKIFGVFVLSGLSFRVLRENKPFAAGTVRSVLLLEDIPGWSEFIVAFALYAVLALILFHPLRYAMDKPYIMMSVAAACLLCCFLPYSRFLDPRLSLFIGGHRFAYFPVVQYAPYFLAGMLYQGRREKSWVWPIAAAALSGLGLLRVLWLGGIPSRFPPDIGWVLLGAFPVAAFVLLSMGLEWLASQKTNVKGMKLHSLFRPLAGMGRSSLFYLLSSNLILFTLAGKNTLPWLKFKAPGLFGQPVQTASGAFWWTLALQCAIALAAAFIKASGKAHENKEDTLCAPSP